MESADFFAIQPLVSTIQPIIALGIGVLILLLPRLLNYLIAFYFIFVGVSGLWPHLL